MRSLLAPLLLLILLATGSARAAQPVDARLQTALGAWVANGTDAGLAALYLERPEFAEEFKEALFNVTRRLGPIVDTEVVAVQTISGRVTRYYIAVYYQRRPLWLRIERYNNGEKAFYLPLRYSLHHDEILPGYVTEFRAP